MIVVSDTTSISALFLINRINLLEQLFKEVVIPEPVFSELLALEGFGKNVDALRGSTWLSIRKATPSTTLSQLLDNLDEGEAHAIAIALELNADLLIIDERKGRKQAELMKLTYTGLGGVLLRAKSAGLIPLIAPVLDDLKVQAGFYLSESVREILLQAADELR
ncbi:MAG: DUF3368 domain-containing protein [Saprospiraceae bacterium]|nr:DUF3368 domain-containing protein [Saprospiraceae bacterium]